MNRRVVTAETEEGRRAIQEVMRASYEADIGWGPAAWARALLVDDIPVSFILLNPDDGVSFPRGRMRAAFVNDTATREDRRHEGHFRALLERTFADVRAEGIAAMTLHGEATLYRRFGFAVYARHAAWFLTPELVERQLGVGVTEGWERMADLNDRRARRDLLLMTDARPKTLAEAAALLRTAAALAKERDKPEIMIMPAAPSLEVRHCPFVDSSLMEMVLACGGRLTLQGADPEGRPFPDADWIKVVDAQEFLRQAVRLGDRGDADLPQTTVEFRTEAGSAAMRVSSEGVEVLETAPGASVIAWPSASLAQLVLGYSSAAALAEIHDTPLSDDATQLLEKLFPRQWRLSVNESWIFEKR